MIDPANGLDQHCGLYIDNGRIAAVGAVPDGFQADRSLDASNCVVCPGLVDLCARLREPGADHKISIATESQAAVAGGVTALCCPPDTRPILDAPVVVELIQKRVADADQLRVFLCGALTRGLGEEGLAGMQALQATGCIAVGNALVPIADSHLLYRALQYARSCGLKVFLHADDAFLRGTGRFHEGDTCTQAGLEPYPSSAELVGLARALLLVEQAGTAVHFCRLSTGRAVGMIAAARSRGLDVSADVGIHHLILADEELDPMNANSYFIPPIRSTEDRAALREALATRLLDCVCSDHQPHNYEAKHVPLSLAEPGATALELWLPLTLQLVRDGHMNMLRAIDCMTRQPATILGIPQGTLSTDAAADICIFDPHAQWTLHTATLRSSGKHSPLEGQALQGQVCYTLLGGRVVYERGAA